ncbi:MAG: ketoacyl-ACP synthase III [Acidimicrobiia bacterium]|nr:ketoacyl-ACP synthase III [Acidimicrobiia bacterium]
MVKPFRLNHNGKLVFPSSIFVELDFSIIADLDHLRAIVRRDFEVKAPTGTEIAEKASGDGYRNRYELLRDLGLHLFWANRFALLMYDKRPTRWRDVPRTRDDVFVPLMARWDDRRARADAVLSTWRHLPARWNDATESELFDTLFDVFSNKLYLAAELPPIKATIAEALADEAGLCTVLDEFDPDHRRYSVDEILDVSEARPELESLRRWTMVLHNQHPWDRSKARLASPSSLQPDDVVVVFHPRNRDVLDFINRVKEGRSLPGRQDRPDPPVEPIRPLPPVVVSASTTVRPRVESLAVRKGEVVCSNDDVVRNAPPSWSPMSADEIVAKTGIERRRYTQDSLEHIALEAARAALAHAGRRPEEIGAVLVCSCTSNRLIPSTACWISGQLGITQTHASADIVAACAGFPYGMAEAIRLLREVERPVLLVLAEKFSDKIGSARPSRMIFGDGAAAVVVAPAATGERGDVEVVQTYASGPFSQVNSIIWPNHDFDHDITVYGPEVKALVKRYLDQMVGELTALPSIGSAVSGEAAGNGASLMDDIEMIIPHQANKTMIIDIAEPQGIPASHIFFNIAEVGNASAASIPIAISDAVHEGAVSKPSLIFAPGFGAGAVGGYVVMTIDPSVVAPEVTAVAPSDAVSPDRLGDGGPHSSMEDVEAAFGG